MSSIMDKGKMPTKMFLRSNSFQKLCSLAHPMRLRGFKSNREALKSVFESLIVTTRGVIQSVTYRILCLLFLTPFTKLLLSRPLQGLVDAVASTTKGDDKDGSTNRLNTVRLILKLTLSMIVSTDKSLDVRCDNELSEDVADAANQDATLKECPRVTLSDSAVQTDLPEPEPEFFDCREPTEQLSAPTAKPSQTCRFLEASSIQRPRRPPSQLAAAVVYGCVLCCAGQLSALVYLLCGDAVRFPPGLIFLILALAYIGFVMTRIFTNSPLTNDANRYRKMAAKKKAAASKALVVVAAVPEGAIRSQQHQPKGLHPVLAAVSKRILATLLQYQHPQKSSSSSSSAPAGESTRPRMSRSATRTRMLLCDDDKTISKVKIL
uniref:Putative conserved plasma membrane protein n=1 Tax=Culex tarsalis TaxID=7177 RepID=A0A1Q3FLG5_CULTA